MLASRESSVAWELRGAWASREPVVLACEKPARWRTLAGWVEHVDASNAAVLFEAVNGEVVSVPCALVLSVRRPHFHEPEDEAILAAPRRVRRVTVLDRFPGQLSLLEEVI